MEEDPYFGKGRYNPLSFCSQTWTQHARLVSQRWSDCFEIPPMRAWISRNCAVLFPHPSSHPSASCFFGPKDIIFPHVNTALVAVLTVTRNNCAKRPSKCLLPSAAARDQSPDCRDLHEDWKAKISLGRSAFPNVRDKFFRKQRPAKDCSDTRVFINEQTCLHLFSRNANVVYDTWPIF